MALSFEEFGKLVLAKRGGRGIRAAAIDAQVSPATLSRVENGHVPDINTFAALCRWIERDPREFLGMESVSTNERPRALVHFKKKKTVQKETAKALGELILAAQRALQARNELLGQ